MGLYMCKARAETAEGLKEGYELMAAGLSGHPDHSTHTHTEFLKTPTSGKPRAY